MLKTASSVGKKKDKSSLFFTWELQVCDESGGFHTGPMCSPTAVVKGEYIKSSYEGWRIAPFRQSPRVCLSVNAIIMLCYRDVFIRISQHYKCYCNSSNIIVYCIIKSKIPHHIYFLLMNQNDVSSTLKKDKL